MKPPSNAHSWVPQIAGAVGPIYLAIADALRDAIVAGQLREGDRLPTHRALANKLGVDLTTVTRAYAEAQRRGLLQATVGRGTFVRATAAPVTPKPRERPVDLGMNIPPVPKDPPLDVLLQQGLARVLGGGHTGELLTYRSGSGTEEERLAGAMWLRPTLGEVGAERMLLSPGAQPGLMAVLSTLAGSGDVILTDMVTYPGVRTVAAQLGLRLVGIAGDADGMLPDAIASACREFQPKALYCVPTIANPTTLTVPLRRRKVIADTARQHGLCIVEDDAYGLLPSDPLRAIASLAPEITYYVATTSKVLSPALRIAYVVVPDAGAAERLSRSLRANVLMASPLLTGLMTAWIRDGTAVSVVSAIRHECSARQQIARETLPADSYSAHPEGLHLWLRLPSRWDRRELVAHLQAQGGLAVVPSDAFAVGGAEQAPNAVRVSLGAALTRHSLRDALRFLTANLASERLATFSEVV